MLDSSLSVGGWGTNSIPVHAPGIEGGMEINHLNAYLGGPYQTADKTDSYSREIRGGPFNYSTSVGPHWTATSVSFAFRPSSEF